MTSMALWWSALVAGILLLASSAAVVKIRASRGRRIPRLGLLPPRHAHAPWWVWAGLSVGILLMMLAAERLNETDGGYFASLGGATAFALVVQSVIIWRHNRRLDPPSGHDAMPEATRPR